MENTTYELRILGLKTLSFKIEDDPGNGKEITEFHFAVSAQHVFIEADKAFHVIVTASVLDNNNLQIEYSKTQIVVVFFVGGYETYNPEKDGEIPDGLRLLLHSISISTLRGIMYSNLKGTYLEKAILPLINPTLMEKSN